MKVMVAILIAIRSLNNSSVFSFKNNTQNVFPEFNLTILVAAMNLITIIVIQTEIEVLTVVIAVVEIIVVVK